MADADGVGAKMLSRLRMVGGKVVDLGASVGGRVVDVGATVGGKVVDIGGTLGTKIVDVTKNLTESDFERLRQLNLVAKQQKDLRKKYTDEELAAVEAKADIVLGQLFSGYFEQEFDPVAHELGKLTEGDNQDQIDEVVERLTAGVETVSGRLSRHVMKKRDMLLAGIDRVAEVEDDLKAAFLITKSGRGTLKAASEEVQRNMRVVGQTRRKQHYMELMEVCMKIKRVKDLQRSLKRAQELGEYGDAIMTCVQSFQGVDTLKQLTVSGELRALVQRLYVDTLRRLDGGLTTICGEFNPEKYTKLLEGYLLQGIDGKALGEKVLQCFRDAINDVTTRVVRSLLLTKPKLADKLAASSALEASYSELCRALPVDMLRPCLLRMMEVIFDVMSSYHVMAYWHGLAVQKQEQAAQMAAADAAGMDEDARRAQAAMASYLSAVNDMLQLSRPEILEAAARRIKDLLNMEGLFKGEDFLQMIDWCQKFVGMGEAFIGGPTELRPQVMQVCARFLPAYHKSNLEVLTTCLSNEAWQDVAGGRSVPPLDLATAVRSTPLYVPAWGEPEAEASFEKLMMEGNPFKRSLNYAGEGKQKTLVDLLAKTQHEGRGLTRSDSMKSSFSEVSEMSSEQHSQQQQQAAGPSGAAQPHQQAGADGHAPQQQQQQGSGAPTASAPATPERQGVSSAPQAEPSGRPPSGAGAALGGSPAPPGQQPPRSRTAFLTISSQQALKVIKHYAHIIRPLHGQSDYIWYSLAETYDVYLLYCFSTFGGMSLEDLVWRDDMLPPRLRGAIIRILSAEGSKYRPIIEELQRNKPAGRGAPIATGLGLLDRFGDKMERLVDGVERSVTRMAMSSMFTDNKIMQAINGDGGTTSVQTSAASMVSLPQASGSSPNSSPGPHSDPRVSSSGASGSGTAMGAQVHATINLQQRVVAAESLTHVANELRAAKAAFLASLPNRAHRAVEQWYAHHVEASAELKEFLYRGAAKAIMQGVWEGERGIPAVIGLTNYNVKDSALKQSPWVDFAVRAFSTFRERLSTVALPLPTAVHLWECAVAVAVVGILDGMAAVRKCTLEGRASMSYDLSFLERQVKGMGPQNVGFRGSFSLADDYIKAFYLPWDELPPWCLNHFPMYGKQRLFTLVEVTAEFNKVKRQQKNELLERIDALDAQRH